MPVLLWTDGLLFLLLFLALALAFAQRHNQQFRQQWRQAMSSRLGAGAAVVLLFYVLLGVLDSIHFHPRLDSEAGGQKEYSTEVLSLLDVILATPRLAVEKTYSAPFALKSFAKERIELADGSNERDYPRLEYGGAHLQDESERAADLLWRSLQALVLGVLVWVVMMALWWLWPGPRQQRWQAWFSTASAPQSLPLRFVALFLLGVCLVSAWLWWLAQFYHVLGTDKVGQDVLYAALKSIRTGLMIGTLTTLIMLPFALVLGIMAGYFQGWIDDLIQYLYTTLNSIPGILLIAASVLMLQVYMENNAEAFQSVEARSDARLFFLCLILGITTWTGLCRLLRAETLKLRELDYVQAAVGFGVSHGRVLWRHILPNVMHLVMISVVLDFSALVLAEAVLAYVEIGVDPSMHSWGNMINSARLEMSREPVVWWSLSAAFVFMFVLVLAANLFADAVRDAFDPRLQSRA